MPARPLTVETRSSPASRLAPTGTSTARSARTCAWAALVLGAAALVARVVVRRVLAAVRPVVRRALLVLRALVVLRVPVPVVFRRVVRLVAGLWVPELVVAILFSYSRLALIWEMIEHVFVHGRLSRVTRQAMKNS